MVYKHESAHILVGWEIGKNGAVCSEQYYRGHNRMEKEQFNAWKGFRDGKDIEWVSPERSYLDLSWNEGFILFLYVYLFGIHTRKSHSGRWELHWHVPGIPRGGLACALLEDCTACLDPTFCLADFCVSFRIRFRSHPLYNVPSNSSRQSIHSPVPLEIFLYHCFSADYFVLQFVLFHVLSFWLHS